MPPFPPARAFAVHIFTASGAALALGAPDGGAARACFVRASENLATSLLLRRASVRALDWVEVPDDVLRTFRSVLERGRGVVSGAQPRPSPSMYLNQ